MSGTSAPRDDTGIGDTGSNGSGRSDSDFADDVAPQNDTDLSSDGAPAPKDDGSDPAPEGSSGPQGSFDEDAHTDSDARTDDVADTTGDATAAETDDDSE